MAYGITPQLAGLLAVDGVGYFGTTSQLVGLVALDFSPAAHFTFTPQLVALVSEDLVDNRPRTSQLVALVAYNEGGRENLRVRAFTFIWDGHYFFVLHCGELGTFLYDLTTKQWSEWQTAGFTNWNAEVGLNWNGRIVVGDNQGPTLWECDPSAVLDEGFRPVTHRTTAILTARGRQYIEHESLYITASVGNPSGPSPQMNLRFSDDNGKTYTSMDPIDLTTESDQELAWTSLGSFTAPGRVIVLEDVGGPIAIDSATSFTNEEQNDG